MAITGTSAIGQAQVNKQYMLWVRGVRMIVPVPDELPHIVIEAWAKIDKASARCIEITFEEPGKIETLWVGTYRKNADVMGGDFYRISRCF